MAQFVKCCAFVSVNTDVRRGEEKPIWPCHFNHVPPAAHPYPYPLYKQWSDGLVSETHRPVRVYQPH